MTAVLCCMLFTGKPPSRPISQLRSIYWGLGLVIASTFEFWLVFASLKKISNSSCVTSNAPIQNGEIENVFCGPSSASLPVSLGGLPMVKLPAFTGTILNFKFEPGMDCSYGLNDVSACCADTR